MAETDIRNRPKAPPKEALMEDPAPQAVKHLTLRNYLTENESLPGMEKLLVDLGGGKKAKAPWSNHFEFYKSNMTGDVGMMDASAKAKAEKLVKDLRTEYMRREELD